MNVKKLGKIMRVVAKRRHARAAALLRAPKPKKRLSDTKDGRFFFFYESAKLRGI